MFMFHKKKIVLTLSPAKSLSKNQKNGLITHKQSYKSLHFVYVSYEHVAQSPLTIDSYSISKRDMPYF